MELLNQIVKDMLEQHQGGEKFFDNLDAAIKNTIIINELISRIKSPNIIVSGNFGEFFIHYYLNNYVMNNNIFILVNGGLRKDEPITDLSDRKRDIEDHEFVFVDDSFYSGKTRDAVQQEIKRNGGRLIRTLVVYDGSVQRDSSVESIYRYYDKLQKPK